MHTSLLISFSRSSFHPIPLLVPVKPTAASVTAATIVVVAPVVGPRCDTCPLARPSWKQERQAEGTGRTCGMMVGVQSCTYLCFPVFRCSLWFHLTAWWRWRKNRWHLHRARGEGCSAGCTTASFFSRPWLPAHWCGAAPFCRAGVSVKIRRYFREFFPTPAFPWEWRLRRRSLQREQWGYEHSTRNTSDALFRLDWDGT